MPRSGHFTQGERPGTHSVGGWVGPRTGTGGVGAENLAPTVIQSPDRPASSDSLCRLSYPGQPINCLLIKYLR